MLSELFGVTAVYLYSQLGSPNDIGLFFKQLFDLSCKALCLIFVGTENEIQIKEICRGRPKPTGLEPFGDVTSFDEIHGPEIFVFSVLGQTESRNNRQSLQDA